MNKNEIRERFKDAVWMGKYTTPIVIGGVGGIGSWAALLLDRAGYTLSLYDPDRVEIVNIGGQFYEKANIGELKVNAVAKLCEKMSGSLSISTYPFFIDESIEMSPISISCFDNMKARKIMFDNWKKNEERLLLIDGRMTAEGIQIFTATKETENNYEKTLFEDLEVQDAPCSFKATSHTGAMIGSLITGIVNNYVTNNVLNSNIREVPEKLEFQFSLLMFVS